MLSQDLITQWHIGPEFEFSCPGQGWIGQDIDDLTGLPHHNCLVLSRGSEPDPVESVAIWSMTVPHGFRDLSQRECAIEYFAVERDATRPFGKTWSGFEEGERTIGGRTYHTLRFDLTDSPTARSLAGPVSGLFVLVFPPDFRRQPRFYVLMFQVDRWSKLDLDDIDGLVDTVVSSFIPRRSAAFV